MSGREWKPGDVAMVEVPTKTIPGTSIHAAGKSRIVVVKDSKGWVAAENSAYFWADDYAFFSEGPRPLVVIDPEDRKQVERLRDLMDIEVIRQNGAPNPLHVSPGMRGNALQAALRSLLEPPKPLEPTGLGAVVEDADGADWHRTAEGRWIAGDGLRCRAGGWGHIAAVKVLSDGVQP
jgi:hypothetical protein